MISGSAQTSRLPRSRRSPRQTPFVRAYLARREALWALRGLRDEALPLFVAASADKTSLIPEIEEPIVQLRPMPEGGEVVQDYRHLILSLRAHPVSFLRHDLRRAGMVTCLEAMESRNRRWVEAAGIVLVRQRPGSAKGVMFITIEDESGIANLVISRTAGPSSPQV